MKCLLPETDYQHKSAITFQVLHLRIGAWSPLTLENHLISNLTFFDTTEHIRARMVAVCVLLNVAGTSSVGATSALLIGTVDILKASAPTTTIANVCTLSDAPVRVRL